MTDVDFETELHDAKTSLIHWMVSAGAEVGEIEDDEEEGSLDDDIVGMRIDEVEFFVGDATCDSSNFNELVVDDDFSLVSVSRNGHHHLEIAALAIAASPFSLDILNNFVDELRPDVLEDYVKEGDTFSDGTLSPSFCIPFAIEVSSEMMENNVWVVRRFRVEEVQASTFHQSMSEFLSLVNAVQDKVLS
jgi:hypothetical protein